MKRSIVEKMVDNIFKRKQNVTKSQPPPPTTTTAVNKEDNVNMENWVYGGAVIVLVYLVFGYGANLLCHFIGVAYPAYVSIHAIETSSKEDDTRWLVYWVTFAVITLVEQFGSILTSLIPFYFLLKCLFLIWCMLPIENNGSNVIYLRFVRPYFMAHHEAADKLIEEMAEKAKGVIGNVMKSD